MISYHCVLLSILFMGVFKANRPFILKSLKLIKLLKLLRLIKRKMRFGGREQSEQDP